MTATREPRGSAVVGSLPMHVPHVIAWSGEAIEHRVSFAKQYASGDVRLSYPDPLPSAWVNGMLRARIRQNRRGEPLWRMRNVRRQWQCPIHEVRPMSNTVTGIPPAHPFRRIAPAWDAGVLFHRALDRRRPNAARVHNRLLGERDNSLADRRVATALEKCLTGVADAVWAARRFALDAVRAVAGRGFGLFVDLGCGYPVRESVHETAQEANPGASVLYVDHDPVVVAHARALLAGGDAVEVVRADVRDELDRVLGQPRVRAWVDVGEPVAVVMAALAEHLADGELTALVDALARMLPCGSVLIFTHACGDGLEGRAVESAAAAFGETGVSHTLRSAKRVRELFSGGRWSWEESPPDAGLRVFLDPAGVTFVGGVATVRGGSS
jgi:SAM-dependent methyltransferase